MIIAQPSTASLERARDQEIRNETAPDESASLGDRRQGNSEDFIPVTQAALIDRLAAPSAWPEGEAPEVRRFFRYLETWRSQQFNDSYRELVQAYELFSPDSDLMITRTFGQAERKAMQSRFIGGVAQTLEAANFVRIDPADVAMILTRDSHYGLDLHVDFTVFEELLIFYRGAAIRRDQRRSLRRFLAKEEFDVPIFQRFFLLFKLKPFEQTVHEVMESQHVGRREAEATAKRLRSSMPLHIGEDSIYIKLFKNIPRSDVEMLFPNTLVRFRAFDKLRLGVTAGGGLGLGALGAAGKLALLATNPIAAAAAITGLGAIVFRQAINFLNQRQRYMTVMAQNLYFHSIADNRSVLTILSDQACEADMKRAVLLYSVIAKESATVRDIPDITAAIEQYLESTFGVRASVTLEDALSQFKLDGIVTEERDGTLRVLRPREAWLQLDTMWDVYIDRTSGSGHVAVLN